LLERWNVRGQHRLGFASLQFPDGLLKASFMLPGECPKEDGRDDEKQSKSRPRHRYPCASGADALVFWDTANPNAETYTFDGIPSMLALATVSTFATNWSGMAAVYLETNGMSNVNDLSGAVLADVQPPSPAPSPTRRTSPTYAGLPTFLDHGSATAGGTLVAPDGSHGPRIAPLAATLQPAPPAWDARPPRRLVTARSVW
jgi:hypothetical protein